MKILQVGSSLFDWGGIERYLVFMTQALLDRGHDVTVVCPAESPLDQRCRGKHVHIAQKGQFSFAHWQDFRRLARDGQFDIIHVHFSPDFVVPVRAMRGQSKAKFVMTRHLVQPWKPFKRWAYGATFDRIIGVSEAARKAMVEGSGFPPAQVVAMHAGCPALSPTPGSQECRLELKIPNDEIAIGFFGRLVIEKGADVLIASLDELPSQTKVHVFGDGPDRERLEDLGLGKRVEFHGMIAEVANAMNAMDCIAIPSWWAEAFPYAVLEALSIGKPIVASAVGGIPEQIEDGVNGLLVPPKDSAALAKAIGRLIEDRSFAIALGERAKETHHSRFTLEHFGERIETVYRDLLAGGNSRS